MPSIATATYTSVRLRAVAFSYACSVDSLGVSVKSKCAVAASIGYLESVGCPKILIAIGSTFDSGVAFIPKLDSSPVTVFDKASAAKSDSVDHCIIGFFGPDSVGSKTVSLDPSSSVPATTVPSLWLPSAFTSVA